MEYSSRRDILGGMCHQQLAALILVAMVWIFIPVAQLYGFCVPAFSHISLNCRVY